MSPVSSPAPEALMQALEDLDYLAALDDNGHLSDLGVILSEFPLPPELAKALLASCEFECVDEMLTLAAMLTGITHLSPWLLWLLQDFPGCFGAPKASPFPRAPVSTARCLQNQVSSVIPLLSL